MGGTTQEVQSKNNVEDFAGLNGVYVPKGGIGGGAGGGLLAVGK